MSELLTTTEACADLVSRLADEIFSDLGTDFALVGIVTGGSQCATLLRAQFLSKYHFSPDIGSIDITLYRDDLYTGIERPAMGVTHIPFAIDNRPLVLVDDVLFTGRTVRAALQEITDLGRPSLVRLAVVIDRGHRELPIQADYVGQTISTSKTDRISFTSGEFFLQRGEQ